jgi:hypothetical protein
MLSLYRAKKDMELQAVTGQLYIINGAIQEPKAVPGLLAQGVPARAARGRDDDFLFVHLTLSGQLEETRNLSKDLLNSISNIFYQTPGSVTAALRKAIIETNKELLGHNLRGENKTCEGAITCAVQRGQELYMAQTGEAFAFLGHNFGIERLPPSPPNRVTPMGRTAGLDIRYFHNWLQAGDMLMLTDPRLGIIATEALRPALIDTDVAGSLEALTAAIGYSSGRVMVVEFTDDAPVYLPDAGRPAPPDRSETRPLTPPLAPPLREGTAQSTATPAFHPPGRPNVNVDVETAEITARRATFQAASGLSRATGWLARFLERLKPARPREEEETGWALPAILAAVIPVLVAVIVTSVFFQRGQVERFSQIKEEMNQALIQARAAEGDTAAATEQYNRVLILAAEADTLRENDLEVERLRNEALAELDGLSGIARLEARLLYEFSPGTNLTSIVLGDELNGDIYLLDSANGLVYRIDTDDTFETFLTEQPQTILFDEQVVGSHVVGRVVDMMWRPRGQAVTRDGLAVLDGQGALISFFPNFSESQATPLGLASEWVQPAQITTFDERLYVLDTGSQEIWRYFPDGDNFTLNDTQRSVTFSEEAGLDQVIDLAINTIDGSVVLLYRDGRIRHFADGRLLWDESEPLGSGMETPFVAPSSIKIAGRGRVSSIFVADPGSGRVIQLSFGGTFLAQFKALDESGLELFSRAADIAILETPLRIFVAAGNKLYLAAE